MGIAGTKGSELRRKIGITGAADPEDVANICGLTVQGRDFTGIYEQKIGRTIYIANRLEADWRRWCIGHAIGHHYLHPGNQAWLRKKTMLATPAEREAEEFAYQLFVDGDEVSELGLTEAWEIAEHFGIPEEMVRIQGRLEV